jgi:hypothetical protein
MGKEVCAWFEGKWRSIAGADNKERIDVSSAEILLGGSILQHRLAGEQEAPDPFKNFPHIGIGRGE